MTTSTSEIPVESAGAESAAEMIGAEGAAEMVGGEMVGAGSAAGIGSVRSPRADALRNRDKILSAARETFAECGVSASLEAIARRAGVGIGTLYRHFPTRQALLEAVYVDEMQQLCLATDELLELGPWEGFAALSQRLVQYLATKKALANELLAYVERDAAFFQTCRKDLFEAVEPVLKRAQQAKVVRADTDMTEVVQLVGGISKIETSDEAQRAHILEIALDGLRCRD